MVNKVYKKGTVLMPSGKCNHLHIVCNDPIMNPRTGYDSVLMVNVTSVKHSLPYDPACMLKAGDHPFIYKDSYVYYKKADIFSSERLEVAVNEGAYSQEEDVLDVTFFKILKGFEVSDEVPYKVFQFYNKYCKE